MKKRILVMLMAAVLLLAAVPAVFAADAKAVEVDSEAALIAAVESGAPAVKLTADIGLHEPLLLKKSIDIDLNKHTVTAYYKAFSKSYDSFEDTTDDDVYIGIAEGSEGMVVATIHDGTVAGNFDARPEVQEGLYAYDTRCVLSLESGTVHLKNLKMDSPIGALYMARGSVESCELAIPGLVVSGEVTAITGTSMADADIFVEGSVGKITGVKTGEGSITVSGKVDEISGAATFGIRANFGAEIGLIDDCDLSCFSAYGYSRMPEESKPLYEEMGWTGDAHIGTIQNTRFALEEEEGISTLPPAIDIRWGASIDLMKGVTIDVPGDGDGRAITMEQSSIGGIQNTTINGCVDIEDSSEIGDMDHVTVTGTVTMAGEILDDEGTTVVDTAHNSFGDITDCTFKNQIVFDQADVGEITGSKFNAGLGVISSTVDGIVNCQFTVEGIYSYGLYAYSDSALGTLRGCTVTLTDADYGCGIDIDGSDCDGVVDAKVTVSGADAAGIRLTDGCHVDDIEGCTVTVSGDLREGGMCGIQLTGDSDVFGIDGCTVTVDAKDESGEDLFSRGVYISDSILGSMSDTTVSGAMLLEGSVSGDIRGSHFDTLEIDNTDVVGSIVRNTVDEDLTVDPGSSVVSIRGNEITSKLYVWGSPEAATSVDKIIGNKAASLEIEAVMYTEPDASVTHIGEVSGNIFICSEDDAAAFINFGTIDLMEDNFLNGTYPFEGGVADGLNVGVIKLLRADGQLVEHESGAYSIFEDEGFTLINQFGAKIEKVEKPTALKAFPDVPAGAWYADAVSFVSESGIMEGSNGLFMPNDNATRAQVAKVMYQLDKTGLPTDAPSFTDVPAGAWYAPYVVWAAQNQIMQGGGDGTFRPTGTITRAELAVVMWNAAGKPVVDKSVLDRYPDAASVPGWASKAMAWAVDAGVIQGTGSGALAPAGSASRCQIAVMLQRYVNAGYADRITD